MESMQTAPGQTLRAIVATLLAAVLVGTFAVALMGRGDSATDLDDESLYSEAALPQQARYPRSGEKFAPGRIVPTPTPERGTTLLMPCQGEGLVDAGNRGILVAAAGPLPRFCSEQAYPAGGPDDARPGFPTDRGPLYA